MLNPQDLQRLVEIITEEVMSGAASRRHGAVAVQLPRGALRLLPGSPARRARRRRVADRPARDRRRRRDGRHR